MIQKLLFIDSSVPEKDVLISNINTEQVKIVKDSESLTDVNFEDITHIAFAWKNYWIGTIKPRFPLFSFSLNNDNLYQQKTIKEIAGNFPKLENIDLITCNLNEDENSEWNDAFSELKDGLSETINVRYSIDRTGSETLQGDWILESHDVNILDEYFANKVFVYNHHLAPPTPISLEEFVNTHSQLSITGNTLNLNGDINIDGATWKTLIINDTDTIAMGMGTPTAPAGNYNINCIDGNGYTITFTGMNNTIESLFFNGTGSNGGTLRELVIKNLIVDGDATNSFKGIVYSEFECPAQQVVVKNCGVENLQINNRFGAIFGKHAGKNSYIKAISCYSTGIIGENSGGICGERCGAIGDETINIDIIECYSSGDIKYAGGGICGSAFGAVALGAISTINIIGCYSTGNSLVQYNQGGGICGCGCGGITEGGISNINIIACYSIGDIGGSGGGICGYACGAVLDGGTSNINIIACYSAGDIDENGGGICGGLCGSLGTSGNVEEPDNNTSNLNLIACYSIGDIGKNGGGICGDSCGRIGPGTSNINIIACYSTGDIGEDGGGICGKYCNEVVLIGFGNVNIIACYSTGLTTNCNIVGTEFNSIGIEIIDTYILIDNNNWKQFDNFSSMPDAINCMAIGIPEPKLFKYDTSKTIKNQLELRFFRALPWDPRSPNPQKPFLLDWSTCDFKEVFYEEWFKTNNAWYINNNFTFTDPANIDWALQLLTNLNSPGTSLDDYEPDDYNNIILCPIDPNDIQLCDMILVENNSCPMFRVTEITEERINGFLIGSNTFYRINTKYPIYSEFINNVNINDPFELNYNCVEDYNIAEANWRGFNLCETTQAPTTQAPTTQAPTTLPPTTLPPTTKPVIKPNYNCCIPIKNKCNYVLGMDYLTQFLI